MRLIGGTLVWLLLLFCLTLKASFLFLLSKMGGTHHGLRKTAYSGVILKKYCCYRQAREYINLNRKGQLMSRRHLIRGVFSFFSLQCQILAFLISSFRCRLSFLSWGIWLVSCACVSMTPEKRLANRLLKAYISCTPLCSAKRVRHDSSTFHM